MTGKGPADAKRSRTLPAVKRSRFRRFDLSNPIVAWTLVCLFAAAMVAILAVRLGEGPPALTEADISTIATKDVRATKDFTYSRVDRDATERSRAERMAKVPSIYRWDVSEVETARRRIREAFAFMREGIAEVRQAEAARTAQLVPGLPSSPTVEPPLHDGLVASGARGARGLRGLIPLATAPRAAGLAPEPSVEAAVDGWIQAHQQDFNHRLLEYVDRDTFGLLKSRRFDSLVEDDLLELVESVMRRQIVADRRAFDDVSVIVIQKRRGDERLEEWLEHNVGAILDGISAVREVDEQARLRLSAWSPGDQILLASLAKQFVKPNLSADMVATEEARLRASESVADLVALQHFQTGQIIVDEGHQITEEHLAIYRSMVGEGAPQLEMWSVVGLAIFLALMLAIVWALLRRDFGRNKRHGRDLLFLGVTLLGMTVVVRGGEAVLSTVATAWEVGVGNLIIIMLPFAAGALLLRLVQGGEVAIVFAVVLALIAGLATELAGVIVPYALISGIIGAVAIKHAKTRMAILKAGMLVGLVSAVCADGLVMFMHNQLRPWDLLTVAMLGLASGLLSAIVVMVALPVAESVFGYTTDIKLLELANLEHPALKDLLLRAPGTYHHSMMVGSLNEAAADAIGANSLLARVGAYYHDIGKMKAAQYFAENQSDIENPHNKLKPNMSALILKAHVKDGIEMARQYKLPKDIIDFIGSHHGTGRIEFFYHKAKEQESPDIPEVREEDYRYPGPKPQSRETGICMIADTVEAAARSMTERTPARLKLMVNKLVNHKFSDGQFDACDLTLRDLNGIAEAMLHVLNAVYHHRPEYPEQRKERERRERERARSKQVREEESVSAVLRAVEAVRTVPVPNGGNGKNGSHPYQALVGPDPDAPVGRVRSDRSGSGEHQKVEAAEGEEVDDGPLATGDETNEEAGEERADKE